jgi:O-Antigen ligase
LASVGFVFLACFLALFLALVSVFLPAWFVVSTLLVPVVFALLIVRPEYALTACVALVCGLVHPAFVPHLPILGGSISAAEATLAMLTLYALWTFGARLGKETAAPIAGGQLLMVSLGLFGISLIVAVARSIFAWGISPSLVLGEARDLAYFIILPVAAIILREPIRQNRFVVSMVVLGCLFSIGQILQSFFSIPVFGGQGISPLETLGQYQDSTTRSNTFGLNVIIYSLLLTVGGHVFGIIRLPAFLAVSGLLSLGIFLTFGRTTFAVVLLCTTVLIAWLNIRKLPLFAGLLLLALLIGSAFGAIFKPESLSAVVFRLTSIGAELSHGYSARVRVWEFEAMLPNIMSHPIAGIGLGAEYIEHRTGGLANPAMSRYMHNAYMYMAGKMGLPSLTLFLLSMATIFYIGRSLARSNASPWVRVVGGAGAVMMIRYTLASLTEPHLMSDYGVINIGIAGAMVYLAAQRTKAHQPSTSGILRKA